MIRNIFYSSVVILRRKELFKLTEKYCKHFDEMDTDEKLIWLMTNENIDILNQICKMIQDNGLRFFKFFFLTSISYSILFNLCLSFYTHKLC